LIAAHHEPPLAGHLGAYRVIGSLSNRYYWPAMGSDVRTYIRGCQVC
jgi:Integrase zinc binding domain